MARMNEILTGRHNRLLQKLFSMKGEPPSPQLSSEIMPVLPLMHGVENRILEGWNRFINSSDLTSGVGQLVAARLRNPKDSNAIAVIEGIWSLNVTTASRHLLQIGLGPTQADLTGGTTAGSPLDIRQGIQSSGAMIFSFALNATSLTTFAIRAAPVNQDVIWIQDENQEIALLPNSEIQVIQQNTQDGRTAITMQWRERFLEDSERSV